MEYYESLPEELEENEMLTLPGEDLDTAAADDDGFTVPCRYLDEFVIFDLRRNNQLVTLDAIEDDTAELRAAGHSHDLVIGIDLMQVLFRQSTTRTRKSTKITTMMISMKAERARRQRFRDNASV